jgi:hypothetical protein
VFSWENRGQPLAKPLFNSPEFALHYQPVARFAYIPLLDYVLYARDDERGPTNGGHWGARWLYQYAPSVMQRGVPGFYSLRVRNESDHTWDPLDPTPVRIAYHWFDKAGSPLVVDGNRTDLPFPVLPGQAVTVTALVVPPDAHGEFKLQWDLVEEFVSWYGDRGLSSPLASVAVD